MSVIVHILHHGQPLCRFHTGFPKDWPAGNKWVGLDDLSDANCKDCLRELESRTDRPKNYLPRIDTIYAVLSVDEGGEGVVAAQLQEGMLSVPLIAADEDRLKNILPVARSMAKQFGMHMRLVKFTTREEIEIITP